MPLEESSAIPKNFPDPKLPAAVEVDEMLTRIKHSHGHYYQVMNLEVWALVETLDRVFPGAWGQFMANRQVAVKQFLERDRTPNSSVDAEDAEDNEEEPPLPKGGRKKEEEPPPTPPKGGRKQEPE